MMKGHFNFSGKILNIIIIIYIRYIEKFGNLREPKRMVEVSLLLLLFYNLM